MSDSIVVFASPGGQVVVRRPASGFDAADLVGDAEPGWTAHVVSEDALPEADPLFRDAWRARADGTIRVDLRSARALKRTAMAASGAALARQLDARGMAALVDGDQVALTKIRALKASVAADAASDLMWLTDTTALAAYEPASFAKARAALV